MSQTQPPQTPIKLAVLDDYANIAPPHFQHLTNGSSPKIELTSYPETLNPKNPTALIERLNPYTIISSMRERTPLPRSILSELPNLKFLLTTGPKNASIDPTACKDLGIEYVGTGPPRDISKEEMDTFVNFQATNEHCWALILGLAKRLARDHDDVVRLGGFQTGLAFGLAGKTLGLLGLGRLGAQCARTGAAGFGMKVVAWSNSLTQEAADAQAKKMGLPAGSFRVVGSKMELFEVSDVISVQYVLSERSKGIVGKEELGVMKKDALLINTSRGPLVDEEALLEALRAGRIGGAALDVFDVEPLPKDSPWRNEGWGKTGRVRF